MTAALDTLRIALSTSAKIHSRAAEHDARSADLEYAAECDEAEAARQEAVAEGAAADALLAGKDAPANGDGKAANLRAYTKIKRAAAEKARALAVEVAAGLPAAQAAVTSAALSFMRASRDEARADLMTAFSGVIEPLARMHAADLVRQALVGDRYSFDPREHDPAELWSGGVLTEKFVKGIPPRLRPEGFSEAIRNRAEELAAEIINGLKEGQK